MNSTEPQASPYRQDVHPGHFGNCVCDPADNESCDRHRARDVAGLTYRVTSDESKPHEIRRRGRQDDQCSHSKRAVE